MTTTKRTPAEMEALGARLLDLASPSPPGRWVNVSALAAQLGEDRDQCRHVVRKLKAAGLWPWPAVRSRDPEFLADLRALSEAGRTQREMAEATGRPTEVVKKALARLGLRGEARNPIASDPVKAREFRRMAASGADSAAVAGHFGISRANAYVTAARLGIAFSARPRTPIPAPGRAAEEARYYLEVRAVALSLASADPGYPDARRAWIAAEKSVRPFLDAVGVVVDGRRVGVDCMGEVFVSRAVQPAAYTSRATRANYAN